MRKRRAIVVFIISTGVLILLGGAVPKMIEQDAAHYQSTTQVSNPASQQGDGQAAAALNELVVKGRAPKTGYSRDQFGNGWGKTNGCDTRDIILYRDLKNPILEGDCTVVAGTLNDPYTGQVIQFTKQKSTAVQIDHVVALSDAWQTGAQQLSAEQRKQLANDPLELLAVDGPANQAKGDGDAATWLPKNKSFRCEYVARQIAVKKKYSLWVLDAEKQAMQTVLSSCPTQSLP